MSQSESETHQASDVGNTAELASTAQQAYTESMAIGFEQARLNYEQAQQAHASELQVLYAELNERSQQAWRAFSEALGAAYSAAPSYQACLDEYRSYLEHLQQLFSGGDAPQRQQAAYNKFVAQLAANSQQGGNSQATIEAYRKEAAEIWKQQPVREALESAQDRYSKQLKKLSGEVEARQVEAWNELLAQMGKIWSQQELQVRTQGALDRLIGASREALVQCHGTVEKSSAKAVQALSADSS